MCLTPPDASLAAGSPAHPATVALLRPPQAMHAARHVRRLDPVTGRAHAAGKRKTSVALVWLCPAAAPGAGRLMVNRRPYDEYFPDLLRRNDLAAPFLGEPAGEGRGDVSSSYPGTQARSRLQEQLGLSQQSSQPPGRLASPRGHQHVLSLRPPEWFSARHAPRPLSPLQPPARWATGT